MARWAAGLSALLAAPAGCVSPAPVTPQPLASPRPTPTPPASLTFAGELTQGGWIRGQAPLGSALFLGEQRVALGSDGAFFAAFDRDAGPQASLRAVLANGQTVARQLTIVPRAWDIERVNVPKTPAPATSPEYQRRRAAELARIAAARTLASDSQGWRQRFVWPATGRISGRFGSQRIYRGGEVGSYHSGIDIAGGGGTPFVAPADGVVILAAEAPFTLEGLLLMIDHGNGLNSAFLHNSALAVKVGERVRQGQVIGRIGATGRATGPHLHWSLKWHDARLDPLLFTGPMPG